MNLISDITNQLKEQKIDYRILYSSRIKLYSENEKLIEQISEAWKNEFIGNSKVPYVDQYLWHVFSYKIKESIEGDQALDEYQKQYVSKIYIFNQLKSYLIECKNQMPKIELQNYADDIYICHHNMKWTLVLPHEMPEMGPYFTNKIIKNQK